MIETIFAAFITLIGGIYLGKSVEPALKPTPDRWSPTQHEGMLKTCGIVCGENNVLSYSTIYGKCVCKGQINED